MVTATGEAEARSARQAREYRRMRLIAGGLLLVMFLVYLTVVAAAARLPAEAWWLAYVRAFAEAAMVGAFADWFAVTALFRHPFGLPIPHTAIVARNKDRIGESLGRFVTNNFLAPEVVADKLRSLTIARRLAEWLSHPANVHWLAARSTGVIPPIVEALGDDHVRVFLRRTVLLRLKAIEAAPLAGRVLGVLVANRHHQALFDRLIDGAGDFLHDNAQSVRDKVHQRSPTWLPAWVDDKLFLKIMAGLEDSLDELRQPDNRWRDQFNEAVEKLVEDMQHDPAYRARGEALKHQLIDQPQVGEYVDSLWHEIRQRLVGDAAARHGAMQRGLERILLALGQRLARDPDMQEVVDGWILRFAVNHVVPQRDEIGAFISGVVRKWDARTVVAKLELQVGKDLQYIRINGTLVGGMVGLVIYAATRWLG